MDPFLIILFLLLFSLSAFFSWTELALMSLAEHKIDSLVKKAKFWSKSLKQIKKNNDRLLITILIWNNLVNVYTAALATSIAISLAETSWLPQASAIGIATWVITFALLLFGEIIPKSIATKKAAKIALIVAPIYKWLMFILHPVILIIEFIIKIFTPKNIKYKITDEEIESFIDMGRDTGSLEIEEHEKIKNILELDETTAEEIMTPRVKIEAIDIDSTVKEALAFYLSHTHSRIPIYSKTIDKIDKFITWRDIISQIKQWNEDKKLSEIKLKNVMKIPLNQPISNLLKKFQKSHKVMSIIIDEYGWVSWLITMEDIIEEVFWEIRDETDREVDEITEISEYVLLCEPDVLIEDVLDKFDLNLPNIWLDEKEFDWETLSYVITHVIEWFPISWEIIKFEDCCSWEDDSEHFNLEFKVIEVNDHKMWKVEVRKVIFNS